MGFLPTLEQAQRIVASNDAFTTTSFEHDGWRIHDFGYRLPGFMDFENPVPGSGLQAYELRGLTFVEPLDGTEGETQRFLMLRKFHALNQTTGFMSKDLANKRIVSCSEKLDGSVVRFVPVGGKLMARTKSSFRGKHAQVAGRLLDETSGLREFVEEAHAQGLAPVFEMVSPDFRIVLPYDREELRLIQLRREADGAYLDVRSHPLVAAHGVGHAVVDGIDTLDDLTILQETKRGVEGWVVMFDDNTLMKAKTRYYDDFHDFFFERNRSDKKMVAMVLGETMDDALAAMAEDDPSRPAAEQVMLLVSAEVNRMASVVHEAIASFQGSPDDNDARRAFTASLKGNPLLGLVMQALKNHDEGNVMTLCKRQVASAAKREEDANKLLRNLRDGATAPSRQPGMP